MIRRGAVITFFLSLIFLMAPLSAAAFNPFHGVDCGAAQGSAVCSADKGAKSDDPLVTTITNVTHILAFIAGIAAIILIIIGGLRYITANGDASSIKSARDTIANALIGLVVIVFAQALIVFVVHRI